MKNLPKTIYEAKKLESKQLKEKKTKAKNLEAKQLETKQTKTKQTKENQLKEKQLETKQKEKIALHKQKTCKKSKKIQFKTGNKIRDLSIDLNVNLFILGMLLIVFNCVFIISALLLAHWINLWWVWFIDFVLVIFCILHSIANFVYNSKNYHFTLHENCMVLNSMWFYNTIIDLRQIKEIKTKIGFWDKLFGRGTCTLTLLLSDEFQTKINLYFLKEDPTNLYNELWAIINANNYINK